MAQLGSSPRPEDDPRPPLKGIISFNSKPKKAKFWLFWFFYFVFQIVLNRGGIFWQQSQNSKRKGDKYPNPISFPHPPYGGVEGTGIGEGIVKFFYKYPLISLKKGDYLLFQQWCVYYAIERTHSLNLNFRRGFTKDCKHKRNLKFWFIKRITEEVV